MSGTTSQAKKSSPQSTKKKADIVEEVPAIEETPKEEKPLAVVEGTEAKAEEAPDSQEVLIESLVEKIDILEQAVCRIATLTGNGNCLKEYGLEKWEPSQHHMRKYG